MKRTSGFSLIEALVAVSILGIALAAVAPVFISFAQVNRENQYKTQALAVAQQTVDGLRQQKFTEWPASGDTQTVTQSGTSYQRKVLWCVPPVSTYCSDGSRHLKVEVSKNDKVYYQVETVYTTFE